MRTSSRRLSLETMEGREVPANVVTVMSGGSLFVLGSTASDAVTVSQSTLNQVTLTPGPGTTIDNSPFPVTRPLFGSLVIELGAGDDNLTFDLASGLTIPGSLVVNYGTAGTGTKTTETVNAGQFALRVGGGIGIRYAPGNVTTTLDNLRVNGNVLVEHMTGDSTLTIDNLAGAGTFSVIGGSLTVLNTQGVANNTLSDTNVGGSAFFANGKARASDNAAGSTTIQNANNTARAIIGGNLAIGNASGNSTTGNKVGDVMVRGSVAMNLGTGNFSATIADVKVTSAPVSIGGSLGIHGSSTGRDTINLGGAGTGLRVGMSVAVTTGSGPATIAINDLTVAGATAIATGAGADTIAIDGSSGALGSNFNGSFAVRTGGGADSVSINSGSASAATTTFRSAVAVGLGPDDDTLSLATAGKVRFLVPMSMPVLFNGGLGTNTKTVNTANVSGHMQTYLHF
jgi:hypothetical protein